ncbi:hypothetical protein U6A24_16215 [Aquimarina gracilis]|uniref:peptidylprolyl isomerase n=1 Tax=Aquimarina gracilis TaxID=874422 RepID=A0ABU5ZYP4_9FLAO|nr:hypothetical protein [Aquimarina gracilis]MEB3347018.1 hypothetical protein [Aquimarina gracilis]
MNVRKYIFASVFALVALYGCNNDDDNGTGITIIPPRDRAEQQVTDDALLQDYLNTHFFTFEDVSVNGDDIPEYRIVKFDTIAGDNSGEQSIMGTGMVTTKKVEREDVEYNLYILKLREGAGEYASKNSDSTLVTYRGETLYPSSTNEEELFDNVVNPVWFDLLRNIVGFREGLEGLRAASGFTENGDGTVTYNDDFGEAIIFIPSGLAYFEGTQNGAFPPYSNLIFNVQVYDVNQADHDLDGIPTYFEDLNGDSIVADLTNDNTDEDSLSNYIDADDDNDGTLTRDEITVNDLNNDGVIDPMTEITFYDDDGDGIQNHLDPDDREPKNE